MRALLRRVRGADRERGAFAVELAVLAPVLLLLFVLVWEAGQVVHAQSQVQSASRDMARLESSLPPGTPLGGGEQLPSEVGNYNCTVNRNDHVNNPVDAPSVNVADITLTCQLHLIGGFTKTITAESVSYGNPYQTTAGPAA